jgi:hypothetical protein
MAMAQGPTFDDLPGALHQPLDHDYTKLTMPLVSGRTTSSYSPVLSDFSAPHATDQLLDALPALAPSDYASGDGMSELHTFRSTELNENERAPMDWPGPPPLSHQNPDRSVRKQTPAATLLWVVTGWRPQSLKLLHRVVTGPQGWRGGQGG